MKEYIVQNDTDNPTNSHGYMFGRTISQLIRCKDCKRNDTKFCPMIFVEMKPNDFCSYGERKEE